MTKTEICVLKLTSGAEIITNIEYDSDVGIFYQTATISKPYRFDYIAHNALGEPHAPQLGFFPYVYSDPEARHLLLNGATIESFIPEINIEQSLKKEYLEKSSGIALA